MNINYLDFEQPIADLLAHIEELKRLSSNMGNDVDMSKEQAEEAVNNSGAEVPADNTTTE